MQMFFPSRAKLRAFVARSKAKGYEHKMVDNGKTVESSRRWAIDLSASSKQSTMV